MYQVYTFKQEARIWGGRPDVSGYKLEGRKTAIPPDKVSTYQRKAAATCPSRWYPYGQYERFGPAVLADLIEHLKMIVLSNPFKRTFIAI